MYRVDTYSIVCGNFGEEELSFEMWREFENELDARQYFKEFTSCLPASRYYVELLRSEDGEGYATIATFGTTPDELDQE